MVVSQSRGTLIWTPKYCSPYDGDPHKGTPAFGKPPYDPVYNQKPLVSGMLVRRPGNLENNQVLVVLSDFCSCRVSRLILLTAKK